MMTTTLFYAPTSIEQIDSFNTVTNRPSIQWIYSDNQINPSTPAITNGTLYTISGFWQEKFLSETSQLNLTNFNVPISTRNLVGIELLLDVKRWARIQDLVIQLILNGELIGDNRASIINPVQADMYTSDTTLPLVPIQDYNIYGSSSDMWGTNLTSADITDPTFGIAVSFKSNIIYPHRDEAYLNQVALRFTYA